MLTDPKLRTPRSQLPLVSSFQNQEVSRSTTAISWISLHDSLWDCHGWQHRLGSSELGIDAVRNGEELTGNAKAKEFGVVQAPLRIRAKGPFSDLTRTPEASVAG